QAVLAGILARLVTDTERLGTGYSALTALQARPDYYDRTSPLVEVTTSRRDVLSWSQELINSAYRDWMTLETFVTDMPVTDDYIVAPAPAMKQSVRVRSIYDRPFVQSRAGARIIGSLLADGQQARVLAELPMKMQLADESCVLLPLTPTGTGGAMLVHARPVVSALRQYFELLWERAVPFGRTAAAPDTSLTGRQQDILGLLAQGLTDDAIASRLGCSAKTVGREAAAISVRLGATSRFAAGAAAQRRGWLLARAPGEWLTGGANRAYQEVSLWVRSHRGSGTRPPGAGMPSMSGRAARWWPAGRTARTWRWPCRLIPITRRSRCGTGRPDRAGCPRESTGRGWAPGGSWRCWLSAGYRRPSSCPRFPRCCTPMRCAVTRPKATRWGCTAGSTSGSVTCRARRSGSWHCEAPKSWKTAPDVARWGSGRHRGTSVPRHWGSSGTSASATTLR